VGLVRLSVGVAVTVSVEVCTMGEESTVDVQVEVRVTGVADRSVVTTSATVNKAKACAIAKTRAKAVERRILLILREGQWRV
jgi:hypothetical protein